MKAHKQVDAARARLHAAETLLATALGGAAAEAGRCGGKATVDAEATTGVHTAACALADAQTDNRETASHLPLGQVRPGARLLDTEVKLGLPAWMWVIGRDRRDVLVVA